MGTFKSDAVVGTDMDSPSWPPTRATAARFAVVLAIVLLLVPAGISAATYEPTNLRAGTITEPADSLTVISVQGFHFDGKKNAKKPARLVAVGPRGNVKWVHNGTTVNAFWFYDVDPMKNGNVLVVATRPKSTVVYELDRKTQEIHWMEEFPIKDTHDVDLINGDQLLIADKENDRAFIYDRSANETVWEYDFHEHFPESGGGKPSDWTHFNDIDKVGDGKYLMSPRNFDQAIVVDRDTKEIELRLGSDDDHEILFEQHNPDYLVSENGTPTILVGDSENNRVVEYAKDGENWTRTWTVGKNELSWPRDADRLQDGNTLITDSMNHRVVEVTPHGRIVWEFYAPWAPYESVRLSQPPTSESQGPTIRGMGESGTYDLSGSMGLEPGTGDRESFETQLARAFVGTPIEEPVREFAGKWGRVTPWIRPVWMTGWDFVAVIAAALLFVCWLLAELVYHRGHIRRRVGRLVG